MPSGIYKRELKSIIKKQNKYNFLTAIEFSHRGKFCQQYWLFRCDCGVEKVICVNNVKNGHIKSCGCSRIGLKNSLKHGMRYTGIYNSWHGMKNRCLNKNDKRYKDWGGRGITICDRWLKFENFYADMGERPEGKSLDRINNNGNYCKENCHFSTPKQQANNRRNNL